MIKAIDDKVFVEELKRTRSEGGIIFPDGAGDPQGYGKVLSIGDDVANKQISVGDVIVFHSRGGQIVLMGKQLLRVLKYDEIYGLLDDGDLKDGLVEMEIEAVNSEGTPKIQPVSSNIIHPVS